MIYLKQKDTVTANKEDDKVNAHDHVWEYWSPIGHDAIVHDSIPVLSSKNLQIKKRVTPQSQWVQYLSDGTNVSYHWGESHLETSEQSLREGVKSTSLHLRFIKVEFASKQLHAQQSEDDEEEEKQE